MNLKRFAFAAVMNAALAAPAAEFRPVAVTASTETYGARYAAAKMIDGDLATYACFQDDSRDGTDAKSDPPHAAAPVTCSFVLDLGEARDIAGLKFVARNCWAPTMASDVSVWACGDGKGTKDLVPLAENAALPPVVNSYAAYVTWPKTTARYLKVRVNDANRKPIRNGWFNRVMWEWARMHGDPISGDGKWYNCQIAEVAAFDALPADAPASNANDVAFPRERLERDWIYQDAGLNLAKVFVSKSDAETRWWRRRSLACPRARRARSSSRSSASSPERRPSGATRAGATSTCASARRAVRPGSRSSARSPRSSSTRRTTCSAASRGS